MKSLSGVFVDNLGNIITRQGDGGAVVISGIPEDKDYKICFAVSIPATGKIVQELTAQSNKATSIELEISEAFTEKFKPGVYFYGIKLKDQDHEQTVIPNAFMDTAGRVSLQNAPTFTVKRKLVECEEGE